MAKRIRLLPAEYKELTARVLKRDSHRCRCCKSPFNVAGHHIIFRSDNGSDTTQNIVLLCQKCHDCVHGKNSKKFIVILAHDGNEETIPDADVGLKFKIYPTVRKRVRWHTS